MRACLLPPLFATLEVGVNCLPREVAITAWCRYPLAATIYFRVDLCSAAAANSCVPSCVVSLVKKGEFRVPDLRREIPKLDPIALGPFPQRRKIKQEKLERARA